MSKVFEYRDPKEDIINIFLHNSTIDYEQFEQLVKNVDMNELNNINIKKIIPKLLGYKANNWYFGYSMKRLNYNYLIGHYSNFLDGLCILYSYVVAKYSDKKDKLLYVIKLYIDRLKGENILTNNIYRSMLWFTNNDIFDLIDDDFIEANKEDIFNVYLCNRNRQNLNFNFAEKLISKLSNEFLDNNYMNLNIYSTNRNYIPFYTKQITTNIYKQLVRRKININTFNLIKEMFKHNYMGVYNILYKLLTIDEKYLLLDHIIDHINDITKTSYSKLKKILEDLTKLTNKKNNICLELRDSIKESDILFRLSHNFRSNGKDKIKYLLDLINILIQKDVNIDYIDNNNRDICDYLLCSGNDQYTSSIHIMKLIMDHKINGMESMSRPK